MKKLCYSLLAMLFVGFSSAFAQSSANNSNVAPADTTIGVIMATPVTIDVTDQVAKNMKAQQVALMNGWEVVEVVANQQDTLVSVDVVPDESNLQSIRLGLNDEVFFKVGSAVLTPKAEKSLQQVAAHLQNFPETNVWIVGYTSNTGGIQVNMDLSIARAQSVLDYFVKQGIDPTRMVAIGRNWQDPQASNATAAGRAANRRVEVWITVNQAMLDAMSQQ